MCYDSTADTLLHIRRVQELLGNVAIELIQRGQRHDASKLGPNEKPFFDEVTPKLQGLTYGSEEYKSYLDKLTPALKHHYENNSHHPEHYITLGINGFDLFDLVEMFCDWKAATERHADGDIGRSIAFNAKRFNMDPQLVDIFTATASRLGRRGI